MRFYHRLIRSLRLPNNAGPGDSQILIGPDVPECMQAGFAAIIMFMPDGWNGGIGAEPTRFLGINISGAGGNTVFVEGWLIWDQGSVCGYLATKGSEVVNTGGVFDWSESISNFSTVGDVTPGTSQYIVEVDSIGLEAPIIDAFGNVTVNGDLSVVGNADVDLGTGQDVTIQDVGSNVKWSVGRGRRYLMTSATDSGAIGTAYTSVLSSTVDMVFKPGRAYEIILSGKLSTSTATVVANFVLNLVIGGVENTYWDFGWFGPEFGAFPQNVHGRGLLRNTGSVNVTATDVKLYMASSAGTANFIGSGGIALAASRRYVEIRDIGSASDYAGAPTVN